MMEFYHKVQRSFDARRVADRLEEVDLHRALYRRGLALAFLLLAPACTTAQPQSEPSSNATNLATAPGDANDVVDLVESFLQLRIAGDGAEAVLSSEGLETYGLEGDPDGRELAGLLYERKGDSYTTGEVVTVESIQGPDGVSVFQWKVLVQLETVDSDEPNRETIFVSLSDRGGLVISGGRTGWEGP